jgi:hypothetical protein
MGVKWNEESVGSNLVVVEQGYESMETQWMTRLLTVLNILRIDMPGEKMVIKESHQILSNCICSWLVYIGTSKALIVEGVGSICPLAKRHY